jgi:hypothetical protein
MSLVWSLWGFSLGYLFGDRMRGTVQRWFEE